MAGPLSRRSRGSGSNRNMASSLSRILGIACALTLLAGCAVLGQDRAPEPEPEAAPQQEVPLILGTGTFDPGGVTQAQPSGTEVGRRVAQLRSDLGRLQNRVRAENGQLQNLRREARSSAGAYHSLKGQMNARLQVGTTPGNPRLVAQWNQAQGELSRVDRSINQMNALSNEASSTASLAGFLLEAARATYGLSGAVDEDHEQLAVLEDEANQTAVVIDRLLGELTQDITRQTAYLGTERANLNAMSIAIGNGEYIGPSLRNLIYGTPTPAPAGGAASLVGQAQPLAVIRLDQPNARFEPALYSAVSQALQRRPTAAFDLVAVGPGLGGEGQLALAQNRTQRDAEQVMRALTTMGLPAERLSLSSTRAPQLASGEVHVYVR